jgi:hypothetical protein
MNETFWSGALIGAFIGLLFTFAARPIERALDRHGERIASEKAAEVVDAGPADRQATRDWLVIQLIEIAVVGAVAGIGAGIMFGLQSTIAYAQPSTQEAYEGTRQLQLVLSVIGHLISLLGGAVVLRIASSAVRTARLLRSGKIKRPRKA